jgi:hypothetical protein
LGTEKGTGAIAEIRPIEKPRPLRLAREVATFLAGFDEPLPPDVITVTLSAVYDQTVTMSYRTVDGTATTSASDFVAKTGTLTFDPGEMTKTITI